MIKKTLLILALLLPIIASAQSVMGSWNLFPYYGAMPDRLIAAGNRAFIQTGSHLYSYNHASEEFKDYTSDLNGTSISALYYTPAGHYLAVGYSDGNIDLIYDDGTMVNLSDIKDAALTTAKVINDFEHSDGKLFAATSFGVVMFDPAKKIVVKSGNYEKEAAKVATLGDKLVLLIDREYYYAPLSADITRLSNFTVNGMAQPTDMRALSSGNSLQGRMGSTGFRVVRWNNETNAPESFNSQDFTDGSVLMPAKSGGGMYFTGNNKMWFVDKEGVVTDLFTLPAELQTGLTATNDGKLVWSATADGVALYDMTNPASPSVRVTRFKPQSATSVARIANIAPSADGNTLMLSNTSYTWNNPSHPGLGWAQIYLEADGLSGGELRTLTPMPAINCVVGIGIDPDYPNRYYAASGQGLHVIEDGVKVMTYTPGTVAYTNQVWGLNFDRGGNLWMTILDNQGRNVMVLPAAKRNQASLTGTSISDFVHLTTPDFATGVGESSFAMCEQSNFIVVVNSARSNIVVIDTKGTYDNLNDDTYSCYVSSAMDTDGKSVTFDRLYRAVEDQSGRVWMGSTNGIFYIQDLDAASKGNLTIVRPKVARNDGTSFADYLLDGVGVTGIAVDGLNCKWIATNGSGIYKVNEDGTEILEHYMAANSMLPTDVINDIYCDPSSNLIYIATNSGLMTYCSDTAPGAPDYSEVYAYPNPVKPDFSGWITVTNLMEDSLVKIADASGNVLVSGRSTGGNFVWDGCNSAGARVKTGVYYVLASQSASGSSAIVTKILILD